MISIPIASALLAAESPGWLREARIQRKQNEFVYELYRTDRLDVALPGDTVGVISAAEGVSDSRLLMADLGMCPRPPAMLFSELTKCNLCLRKE
ncbi:hypothetical protein Aduo_002238 [Ancylostoma duodenale]